MKKIILFLIITFSINTNAQLFTNTAKVFFTDGTIKEGFGKFDFGSTKTIKFKENKKDKYQKYNYIKVDKFIFDEVEYDYKIIKGKTAISTYRVKRRGKVSLYYDIQSNPSPMGMGVPLGGGVGVSIGINTSREIFYIGKNNEDQILKLYNLFSGVSKKKFKKIVPEYFGDCEELINKIKEKEFKRRDIVEIVDFYNNKCNK